MRCLRRLRVVGPGDLRRDHRGLRSRPRPYHRSPPPAYAAAATWNSRLAAVGSFCRWAQSQGWIVGDPLAGIERRPEPRDDTTPIRYNQLHVLWTRADVHVREKTLWRMLYETAARANEILARNIEDLDVGMRRAVVRGKGGHRQEVVWASGTAVSNPVIWPAGGVVRCLLLTVVLTSRLRWWMSVRIPGWVGCRISRPGNCSVGLRDGRCISCATPLSLIWGRRVWGRRCRKRRAGIEACAA